MMAEVARRLEMPHVTKDSILQGLRQVGIATGDIVFVHASLSAFGHVAGGADAVVDALLETVGDSGTVAVPTFTWSSFHQAATVTFDTVNTPSEGMGLVAETLRQRPQAMRSRHVCHSVAAIGPHAEAIMADGVHPFWNGSSLQQLCSLDSWCLMLGVTFDACTLLHAVEELMQVPYRYYRDFRGSTVILPDGAEVAARSVEFLPREGTVSDFAKMGGVFERDGILQTARVGGALLTNARARDIVVVTKRHLEEDPYYLMTSEARACLLEEDP